MCDKNATNETGAQLLREELKTLIDDYVKRLMERNIKKDNNANEEGRPLETKEENIKKIKDIFDQDNNQETYSKLAIEFSTDANEATITTPGWLNKVLVNPNSIDTVNYIGITANVTTANPIGNLDFYLPTIDSQGIITLKKGYALQATKRAFVFRVI